MNRRHFLRALGGAAVWGWAGLSGTTAAGTKSAARPAADSPGKRPPNIVLIFVDDLGWPAVSCYGNRHVQTRNIDRLAAEGMKFTDAYVTPQCTPSRAALLTGQHTARNHMWHVIPKYEFPWMRLKEPEYLENLPRGTHTVGKALQAAGYRTACIGKWHLTTNKRDGFYLQLNEGAAQDFGFDYAPPRYENQHYHQTGDKGVMMLTDQAIDFMRANRENPFFLYLAHHTIHGPVLAPEDFVEKYRGQGYPEQGLNNATYLAALEHLDNSVGRLLNALEELDIANDTVVMFLSDNGGVDQVYRGERTTPAFSNAPLRYGKGTCYEGGIRVPLLVRWPRVVEAGAVCDTPVHVVDFYPTAVELAQGKLPDPDQHVLDGRSIVPLLTGTGTIDRDAIYFHMPLYDMLWGATPAGVIRCGDWKLIEFFGDYVDREDGYRYVVGPRIELYNLRDDPGETNDLSDKMPAKTKELLDKLHAWQAAVRAPMPHPNPNFNMEKATVRPR